MISESNESNKSSPDKPATGKGAGSKEKSEGSPGEKSVGREGKGR
jgi:hypothetical protein